MPTRATSRRGRGRTFPRGMPPSSAGQAVCSLRTAVAALVGHKSVLAPWLDCHHCGAIFGKWQRRRRLAGRVPQHSCGPVLGCDAGRHHGQTWRTQQTPRDQNSNLNFGVCGVCGVCGVFVVLVVVVVET